MMLFFKILALGGLTVMAVMGAALIIKDVIVHRDAGSLIFLGAILFVYGLFMIFFINFLGF